MTSAERYAERYERRKARRDAKKNESLKPCDDFSRIIDVDNLY